MCSGDEASDSSVKIAYALGKLIAGQGWILLSGGRKRGAMNSVNQGAKSANGLTIGIIPTKDNDDTSDSVDVSIVTGMGSARNNINILSSDVTVVIADGISAGTASEAAMALKARRNIILLGADEVTRSFFQLLDKDLVLIATTPEETIAIIKKLIN